MKYQVEKIIRILNTEEETYIDVIENTQGFGCIEIQQIDINGELVDTITMFHAEAKLVAEAILDCVNKVKME